MKKNVGNFTHYLVNIDEGVGVHDAKKTEEGEKN